MQSIRYVLICFIFLFYWNFGALASEQTTGERRTETYSNFEQYLKTNAEQEKILYVGAGLIFDDFVVGTKRMFLPQSVQKKALNRNQHYPKNAYLIDLDGKFPYDPTGKTPSHSDLKADITKTIGTPGGLPKELVGKFDTIYPRQMKNSISRPGNDR